MSQINEAVLEYYQANGAVSSSYSDAEYEFLVAQGQAPTHRNDMMMAYLRSLGLTGSLADMKRVWYKSIVEI